MSRLIKSLRIGCFCAVACVAAPGCDRAVLEPVLNGELPLARYNGQPIPATLGLIGPEPGTSNPGECMLVVTAGNLSLDSARQRFVYWWDWRSSCDQRLLGHHVTVGTFATEGRRIRFEVETIRLEGAVTDSSISVLDGSSLLEFRRT